MQRLGLVSSRPNGGRQGFLRNCIYWDAVVEYSPWSVNPTSEKQSIYKVLVKKVELFVSLYHKNYLWNIWSNSLILLNLPSNGDMLPRKDLAAGHPTLMSSEFNLVVSYRAKDFSYRSCWGCEATWARDGILWRPMVRWCCFCCWCCNSL